MMLLRTKECQRAQKLIEQYIKPGYKIAVAVSGGKDSMALLFLILQCSQVDKKDIAIVNVNHKIRGSESDLDSRFVENFAQNSGLKFIYKEIDVPAAAKISGKSLETAARDCRYGFFKELVLSGGFKYVLTAHHLSDDVESILMHIFRGCGLNGLKGMSILNDSFILRPFLTTPKDEIDEYIKKNNIKFKEDSTNADSSYNRNFLRNEIIPLIKERWNGFEKSLAFLKEEAETADSLLNSMLDPAKIEKKEEGVYLSVDSLINNPLSGRYVIAALSQSGCNCDVTKNTIDSIIDLAGMRNGAKAELINNLVAIKEYENIFIFEKKEKRADNTETPFVLGETDLGNVKIIIKSTKKLFSEDEKRNDGFFTKTLYADKNKIPPSTVIRFRRDGDVFKSYNGGTKKLKEYFIDLKIPVRLRDDIPLLCDKNEVLAVFGFEISDKIKIDDNPAIIKMNAYFK